VYTAHYINVSSSSSKKQTCSSSTNQMVYLQPCGFVLLNVTSTGKFQTKCCRSSWLFFVIWVIPSSRPCKTNIS